MIWADIDNDDGMHRMKSWIVFVGILVLTGCAQKSLERENCSTELRASIGELAVAKERGFAQTSNYRKALRLIEAARNQQRTGVYEGCSAQAQRARIFIAQSFSGI